MLSAAGSIDRSAVGQPSGGGCMVGAALDQTNQISSSAGIYAKAPV